MDQTPLDLEQHLQRHGSALRLLARNLVSDAAAADDAVQETWLHAARQLPRDEGRVGGWLATVLRRAVRRTQRGERRRRQREQAVARDAVAPDHREVAARTETAHRLLTALNELQAPYREAIWQRYFEGVPPRSIAQRSGVPLATVKSRLQRGLQQLRERLGGEGEADWRGALATAFGLGKESFAVGTIGAWQGVVMAASTKGMVAAAAVAFAAAWWWWPVDAAPPIAAREASIAVPVATSAPIPEPPPDLAGQRVTVEPAAAAAPAVAAQPAIRSGRVVDAESGEPLAGVTVTLGFGMQIEPNPTGVAQVTGVDGRFEFPFEGGKSPRIWCAEPHHVRIWFDGLQVGAGQVDDVGDVRMRPGRVLAGRVVDQRGEPLPAGIHVGASYPQLPGASPRADSCYVQCMTMVDGTFCFATAVPFEKVAFDLGGRQYELVGPKEIEAGADSPTELTLVARPRASVRGIVVDEAGQPIAGVELGIGPEMQDAVTAADGSFVLTRDDRGPERCSLHVVDAAEFMPPPPRDLPWNSTGVRIVLGRAAVLPIEVVDAAGVPIEEFGVVAERSGMRGASRGALRQRGHHPSGRLDVTGIVLGSTSLHVVPDSSGLVPGDPLAIAAAVPMRIVLARRRDVAIEVRCAERPVADALVEWVRAGAQPLALTGQLASLRRAKAAEQPANVGLTAADGVAHLLCDPDSNGRCLRVSAPHRPEFILREPTLPHDGGRLRVELPSFGVIQGQVTLRGRSRENVRILLSADGQPSQNIAAEPDGSFRSQPLVIGIWQIEMVVKGPILESRGGSR